MPFDNYLAQKNLKIIDAIIDLALIAGMSMEKDNSGQLVLYTGVTNVRRHPDGDWSDLDGIAFLTNEQIENNDYHKQED